jgi:rhodanese-related sulfurtransferase
MSVLFRFFVVFYLGLFFTYASSVSLISVHDSKELLENSKAVIIDVRESSELKDGVVKNALLLPFSIMINNKSAFDKEISKITKDKTIIVYCASGRHAGIVGAEIKKMGFNVFNMEKYNFWKAAGLPIDYVSVK